MTGSYFQCAQTLFTSYQITIKDKAYGTLLKSLGMFTSHCLMDVLALQSLWPVEIWQIDLLGTYCHRIQ